MENIEIIGHTDILRRIIVLKAEKAEQEAEIKETFRDFLHALDPVSIVKSSLRELAGDKVVHMDLAKIGMNLGADLIIYQLLGKNQGAKGFLRSLLLEKISKALINSNAIEIISGITNLLHKKTGQDT